MTSPLPGVTVFGFTLHDEADTATGWAINAGQDRAQVQPSNFGSAFHVPSRTGLRSMFDGR